MKKGKICDWQNVKRSDKIVKNKIMKRQWRGLVDIITNFREKMVGANLYLDDMEVASEQWTERE